MEKPRLSAEENSGFPLQFRLSSVYYSGASSLFFSLLIKMEISNSTLLIIAENPIFPLLIRVEIRDFAVKGNGENGLSVAN